LIDLIVGKILRFGSLLIFTIIALGRAPVVLAGTYCAGTTVRSIINYGCTTAKYCAVAFYTNVPISCPNDGCSSDSYDSALSMCEEDGVNVGVNDYCNGNGSAESVSTKTTQCYVYCNENNWTSCSESCGGGIMTNDCGDSQDCNTQPCCTETAPASPTAVSPMTVDGYTEKTGTATLTWTAVTAWGEECTGSQTRGYEICVSGNAADPCNGQTPITVAGEGVTSYQASGMTSAINYWQVRAKNKAGEVSSWSSPQNFCYYGSDSVNPLPALRWSACDGDTHMRSRTCEVGCDCSTVSLSEVCQAEVSGTFFDASYSTDCATGDTTASGLSFTMTDTAGTPPALIFLSPTFNGTTNYLGNYAVTLYPRAYYDFDFTSLSTFFDVTAGPRVFCGTSSEKDVLVQDSDADRDCLTQPCTTLNNVSFGFWKIFGGWWQAVGGNAYGAGGVKSYIPPQMASTDQRLILPDTNGRYGVLSYGTKTAEELGQSSEARVSTVLWEVQSLYQGLRFDFNYYKTRMDVFTQTSWDGGEINYNDGGAGFQIFAHTGDVTLGALSLSAGQKAILLVDGSVTVNGNLLTPEGAFLSIVASENIVFNPGVTQAQGWFVAETIDLPCLDANSDNACDKTDTQFLGEGSFVGWTNILLGRDQGLLNNSQPSEKFTLRKDMLISAPTPMKVYTKRFTPFIP